MNEQIEAPTDHGETWPMPSADVLRELEPPELRWSESEWPVSQQFRLTATG